MHIEPQPQTPADELITDRELARFLRVGMTTMFELQKQPDFPPPIWLGPRLKRHRKAVAMQWLLAKQNHLP